MFADEYIGGAELSTEALIDRSPIDVQRVHAAVLTDTMLQQWRHKHWVFGNCRHLPGPLWQAVTRLPRYSVIEFDFRYCRFATPQLHLHTQKSHCDCARSAHGERFRALYRNAYSVWWMSRRQRDVHQRVYPEIASHPRSAVLSSMFRRTLFEQVRERNRRQLPKHGWVYCKSRAWVKGSDRASDWCRYRGVEGEGVAGLSHDQMMARLSTAKGVVCLPNGFDTCPRVTIEARLLGCELVMNSFVLHKDEPWFAGSAEEGTTELVDRVERYVSARAKAFWDTIMQDKAQDTAQDVAQDTVQSGEAAGASDASAQRGKRTTPESRP